MCLVIQEELGYQIIGVEELSMKLLQRLNYASRVMEASASHLQEGSFQYSLVHPAERDINDLVVILLSLSRFQMVKSSFVKIHLLSNLDNVKFILML